MSASRTLLLALLALAVTAAPARAGEYTVTACPSPLGVQPERGGWAFDPGGLNTQPGAPSCGTGFALSLWLAGDQPAQHWATWTFDPPPELPVVGYRIERRWHINGTTGPMAWFYDYGAAEWNQAGQSTAAEYCSPSQCPAPGPAGSDTQPPLVRSGILADKVVLQLGCGFSPYNCPQINDPQGGGSVLVRKAEMTLRDSEPAALHRHPGREPAHRRHAVGRPRRHGEGDRRRRRVVAGRAAGRRARGARGSVRRPSGPVRAPVRAGPPLRGGRRGDAAPRHRVAS